MNLYGDNLLSRLALTVFIIFLSGCATHGVFSPASNFDPSKESIFVIGVSPENFWIELLGGEIKSGGFQFHWNGSAVQGWPTDGYLVGKVKGGELMAITKIDNVKKNSAFKGKQYVPCARKKTLTFKAPVGKILYITDINYSVDGDELSIEYENGFGSAKQFLDKNYPKLKDKMEPHSGIEFYPAYLSCRDVNIIVI